MVTQRTQSIEPSPAAKAKAGEFTKASPQDKAHLASAIDASNKRHLQGVSSSDQLDDAHKAVAEKGRKVILTSVRQGAELTREVFLLMQACEGPDYVEATFKLAEAWAIKALRDGQPEGEKPIKNLADIAKIQGGAGAASYITTKSRLIKYMKDGEELVDKLQNWYNFQAKHDGEPQMFVQPDLLNPWSKRYQDEKRGWSQFTRDARLAEQCAAQLESRKAALERAKGKDAAAQTGQNGDQTRQGMESGTRQRGNLADSTQKCLNAVIRAVQDASEELPIEQVNGILSTAVQSLLGLMEARRNELKARVARTSSEPSASIAAADAPKGSDNGQDVATGNAEQSAESDDGSAGFVRPQWLKQEDWDAATEAERATMIDDGQEAYEEEAQLMERGEEVTDAGTNEPQIEVRTADEPPPSDETKVG